MAGIRLYTIPVAKKKRKKEDPVHKDNAAIPGPHVLLIILVLALSSLFIYFPVAGHDFLNYDDELYVTDNPMVNTGITADGIYWAFTSGHAKNWHPLTWLSHMLDAQIYGLKPGGHHLTNLLVHMFNTLILFLVLWKMTGRLWPSALTSLFFAVHPLNIQSVAWIAERKNVLSTFFWFSGIYFYYLYAKRKSILWYSGALASLAFGLMSKPMLVTFPFVLLLLDFWPLQRLKGAAVREFKQESFKRLLMEKSPFFLLSAVSSFVTFQVQDQGTTMKSIETLPLMTRMANAVMSYGTYLAKMFWPSGLSPYYPYHRAFPAAGVLAVLITLGAITYISVLKRRSHPYFLTGWLWYLGTLVPVIGIIQVGAQSMADRYAYVPMIGILLAVIWWAADMVNTYRVKPFVISGICLSVFSGLAAYSHHQVSFWKDSKALFTHALLVTKDNAVAHNNLGKALNEEGNRDEALAHFREAARISPDDPDPQYNLGILLSVSGKYREAIEHLSRALVYQPGSSDAYYNIGVNWGSLGDNMKALENYRRALEINPENINALYNTAVVIASQGKKSDAVQLYKQVLLHKPDHKNAIVNLGVLYFESGQAQESAAQFEKALQLDSEDPKLHYNLALVLSTQGKTAEAIYHYRETLKRDGRNAVVYYNLGTALELEGNIAEAEQQFRKCLELDPGNRNAGLKLQNLLSGRART